MPATGYPRTYSDPTSEFQTILLPSHSKEKDTGEAPPRVSDDDPGSPVSEKPWKPTIYRHPTWTEEDRKHELQARLLDTERGKENGFTEVLSE